MERTLPAKKVCGGGPMVRQDGVGEDAPRPDKSGVGPVKVGVGRKGVWEPVVRKSAVRQRIWLVADIDVARWWRRVPRCRRRAAAAQHHDWRRSRRIAGRPGCKGRGGREKDDRNEKKIQRTHGIQRGRRIICPGLKTLIAKTSSRRPPSR